jgi:catechol 2,3-dioxygenase-like lactoylglutathione lyase family enzyme
MGPRALAAEGGSEFSRAAVDIGIVVGDMERSVRFYTEALGLLEDEGYTIPPGLAERLGLAEGEQLEVRLLAPANDNTASRIKLIAAPGARDAAGDRGLSAEIGFRYVTLFVADIGKAAERLRAAGIESVENAPVVLGEGSSHEVFVMLVADPDGNRIEIVGPDRDEE